MSCSNRLTRLAALAAVAVAVSACVPTYGISEAGYYDENGVWYDSAQYPDRGYFVNSQYAAGAYDPNQADGYYYAGGTWYYPVLTQRTYYVYDRRDDDRYRRHEDRREGRHRDHDGKGRAKGDGSAEPRVVAETSPAPVPVEPVSEPVERTEPERQGKDRFQDREQTYEN